MKIQNWFVSLSNDAKLEGNGALLGSSRTGDDSTLLTLNVRQGKTSLNVTLTLPGKVFVTDSGTKTVTPPKESETPAPVTEVAPAVAA